MTRSLLTTYPRPDRIFGWCFLVVLVASAGFRIPLHAQNAPPSTYKEERGERLFLQTPEGKVQWASTLLGFSTQAGEKGFAARQVLGKPDKLPATGISPVAWMPDMRSRLPEEWVKVGFAEPMTIRQILVAENARPGAIAAIYLFDERNLPQTVYLRDSTAVQPLSDADSSARGRLTRFVLERECTGINALMLLLKPLDSIAIHQIDAIGIADYSGALALAFPTAPEPDGGLLPENLGVGVNSFFDEIFPVIAPDGQTLYFDRKNHPANLGPGNYDDIWISDRQEDGSWGNARNAGEPLNNPSHNFVCSISPDGNTMLLGNVYDEEGQRAGLSFSYRVVDGWSFPTPVDMLDYYNRDEFGEYQLASNGKVILLAVERDDGLGQRDLYASFLMKDRRWSAPLHLGPDINSAALEMSPFLAPDMRTLYFSSSGFPGYGSNDMFMSRRLDESWTRWTEPVNLGPGLNSADLDAYYTLPASGDFAYFASANRSIGRTDLFRLALPEIVQPEPVVLVSGPVQDAVTGVPLSAEIRYMLDRVDSLAGIARSRPEDGRYQVALPYGERYRMEAAAEGYFALVEELDLEKISAYQEISRTLMLIPLRKGQVVPMKEVFFPVNSDSLLPESYRELDRVAELMTRYPALRIEIGGHTNDRCSESYCQELSRKRARSVARYFYEHNFPVDRVRWVGYGSSRPIADNETEAGRQQNQRVEFTITEFAE